MYLRGTFPELATTIYQIEAAQFLIYCEGVTGDFLVFQDTFDSSIRPITAPVRITNIIPVNYIRIISSISDFEVSRGFEGILMTKHSLLRLLLDKFPNVKFFKVDDSDGVVTISIASYREKIGDTTYHRFLNIHEQAKLDDFLQQLRYPAEFKVIEQDFGDDPDFEQVLKEEQKGHAAYANDFIRSTKIPFIERDKVLWTENVDKIFAGQFSKKDLYFYNAEDYSCYVDFSVFPNIDIRNHLFLFQTVYLTIPFETNIEEWLAASRIEKKEFIELIVRNRVKILLTQPERRYDLKFLYEVFEANPTAVISKRALAALEQIDIVEISDSYFFNDVDTIRELQSLCSIVSPNSEKAKFLYEMLVWPIKARRTSFEQLHRAELFLTSSFGVNKAIEGQYKLKSKRDVTFDLTVNSSPIHLASALNATYFPFTAEDGYTDKPYAEAMGKLLNFYKLFSPANIRSLVGMDKNLHSGIQPILPIEIMEFNEYIPITELEDVLNKDAVFPESRRLIDTIAKLPVEDREAKIDYYNSVIRQKVNRRKKSENLIDIGKDLAADLIGAATQFALFGTSLSLLKIGRKYAKGGKLITSITKKIENAIHTNPDEANIHYLMKINRVAKLKKRPFWQKVF